jgi:hypothetical protein
MKFTLLLILVLSCFLWAENTPQKKAIPTLKEMEKLTEFSKFPVYLNEFLDEMGAADIQRDKPEHIAVEDAIKKAGMDYCFKMASKAVDPETGGAYFKIIKYPDRYMVRKTYPLLDYYITASIIFYVKNGIIADASLMRSVTYTEDNIKKLWNDEKQGKQPNEKTEGPSRNFKGTGGK